MQIGNTLNIVAFFLLGSDVISTCIGCGGTIKNDGSNRLHEVTQYGGSPANCTWRFTVFEAEILRLKFDYLRIYYIDDNGVKRCGDSYISLSMNGGSADCMYSITNSTGWLCLTLSPPQYCRNAASSELCSDNDFIRSGSSMEIQYYAKGHTPSGRPQDMRSGVQFTYTYATCDSPDTANASSTSTTLPWTHSATTSGAALTLPIATGSLRSNISSIKSTKSILRPILSTSFDTSLYKSTSTDLQSYVPVTNIPKQSATVSKILVPSTASERTGEKSANDEDIESTIYNNRSFIYVLIVIGIVLLISQIVVIITVARNRKRISSLEYSRINVEPGHAEMQPVVRNKTQASDTTIPNYEQVNLVATEPDYNEYDVAVMHETTRSDDIRDNASLTERVGYEFVTFSTNQRTLSTDTSEDAPCT